MSDTSDIVERLRDCPFCGGTAEIERHGTPRQSTIYACNECGCRLETGEEWDHGADWNKRSCDAEITALRYRLEKAEGALRFCANTPFSGWTIAQSIARAYFAAQEPTP